MSPFSFQPPRRARTSASTEERRDSRLKATIAKPTMTTARATVLRSGRATSARVGKQMPDKRSREIENNFYVLVTENRAQMSVSAELTIGTSVEVVSIHELVTCS